MSKRILVVEDQEDNRRIVRDLLAANDYEMTEAENGEEAVAADAAAGSPRPVDSAGFRVSGRSYRRIDHIPLRIIASAGHSG